MLSVSQCESLLLTQHVDHDSDSDDEQDHDHECKLAMTSRIATNIYINDYEIQLDRSGCAPITSIIPLIVLVLLIGGIALWIFSSAPPPHHFSLSQSRYMIQDAYRDNIALSNSGFNYLNVNRTCRIASPVLSEACPLPPTQPERVTRSQSHYSASRTEHAIKLVLLYSASPLVMPGGTTGV